YEVFLLKLNLGVGIFTAGFTEGRRIYFYADFADFFFDFQFDWQTMTVPTWHVWRIKTIHDTAFDNDVFEYFIDCMTQMDLTIGIDRKSTRLNSSHVKISYAVFCLKKKKKSKWKAAIDSTYSGI